MKDKYLILLIDGMADYPLPELGEKTPLEKAATPVLDKITPFSEMGIVKTVPDEFPPGSDVANMSVLGYNPAQYYTGRSPFEALSIGVDLEKEDIIFRCNLVTLSEEKKYKNRTMKDYSAGEIPTEEAAEIIKKCQEKLGNENLRFYPGVSYRHVLVWKDGENEMSLTPPHDILDKKIADYLPAGKGSEIIFNMMKKSATFLPEHTINLKREIKDLFPANSIWLWGKGTKPKLPNFHEKFGLKGSVISAVDLIKGLGIASGLKPEFVEGATGRIDTNFQGKVEKAIKNLNSDDDFVYLHFEAADEASHQGSLENKIKSIEKIDNLVLKRILEEMGTDDNLNIMVLPDHYTPLTKRTHVSDPVPFMIYRQNKNNKNEYQKFTEKNAEKTGLYFEKGYRLIDYFLEK